MSGSTAKGVVVIATLGITLFCCVFGAVRMAQRSPGAPAVATATAPASTAPPVPAVTPLDAALRRLSEGETLAPAECLGLVLLTMESPVDARLTPTHDPRIWQLIECQWRADRAQGGRSIFAMAMKLRAANIPVPPEHAAIVQEAMLHLANNPSDLAMEALTKGYLEIEMRDITSAYDFFSGVIAMCPNCERVRALQDARRRLTERMREFPVDVADIRALQLRYADLKGRLVRVRAFVLADTYYNCKYRSQSQWRGMKLRQGLRSFDRMNVYCTRGDRVCDTVYEVATTGNLEGTALVRYPTSNRICEETQAELVDFLADE